jgi:carbon storage regulator
MLVLSRHRDEAIIIGDDVEISIIDIKGEKVRLGITSPTHVPVHRKEVYEAIKRELEELERRDKSQEPPYTENPLANYKNKSER